MNEFTMRGVPIIEVSGIRQEQWLADPVAFFESVAEEVGSTFWIRGPKGLDGLVVSDPVTVKALMVSNDFDTLGDVNESVRKFLTDGSMVFNSGERHGLIRKALAPCFAPRRIEKFRCEVKEILDRLLSDVEGSVIASRSFFSTFTIRVIIRLVFGDFDQKFNNKLAGLFLWPIRNSEEIKRLILDKIGNTEEGSSDDNFCIFDVLYSMYRDNSVDFHEEDVLGELVLMIFAGNETSASVIAWALHFGVEHDIRRLLKSLSSEGEVSDLCKAFTYESMRLYPPVMLSFTRIAKCDTVLNGIGLKGGDRVWIGIYLLHRDKDIFTKPNDFVPERFVNKKYPNNQYCPFGGGDRYCLGWFLALLEVEMVLKKFFIDFTPSILDDPFPERKGLSLAPSDFRFSLEC